MRRTSATQSSRRRSAAPGLKALAPRSRAEANPLSGKRIGLEAEYAYDLAQAPALDVAQHAIGHRHRPCRTHELIDDLLDFGHRKHPRRQVRFQLTTFGFVGCSVREDASEHTLQLALVVHPGANVTHLGIASREMGCGPLELARKAADRAPSVTMRLGLIGDVHAEDERLRVAIDALAAKGVDRILCTGDVVDGHGDVDRTCALLSKHRVLTVRGNHDRWIRDHEMRTLPNAHAMTALAPASIALLKTLPATLTLDLPRGKLLLCHGIGPNDMGRLGPDDGRRAISSNEDLLTVLFDGNVAFMVSGHTHRPMARRFERGLGKPALIVVNAGTLAREEDPGFAVLDTAALRVDFHHIDENLSVTTASRAPL